MGGRSPVAAVVDGPRLLVTPLADTVVPPPMSAHELVLPAPVSAVCQGPAGAADWLWTVTADRRLHAFRLREYSVLTLVFSLSHRFQSQFQLSFSAQTARTLRLHEYIPKLCLLIVRFPNGNNFRLNLSHFSDTATSKCQINSLLTPTRWFEILGKFQISTWRLYPSELNVCILCRPCPAISAI